MMIEYGLDKGHGVVRPKIIFYLLQDRCNIRRRPLFVPGPSTYVEYVGLFGLFLQVCGHDFTSFVSPDRDMED